MSSNPSSDDAASDGLDLNSSATAVEHHEPSTTGTEAEPATKPVKSSVETLTDPMEGSVHLGGGDSNFQESGNGVGRDVKAEVDFKKEGKGAPDLGGDQDEAVEISGSDSVRGHVDATKGDAVESTVVAEDVAEALSSGRNLGTKIDVIGGETEVGDVSQMEEERDGDHEAPGSHASLVDMNRAVQEEGNSLSDKDVKKVDVHPLVDNSIDEANLVTEETNLVKGQNQAEVAVEGVEEGLSLGTNHATEAEAIGSGVTEVGDGSLLEKDRDKGDEAPGTLTSFVEMNQSIQEERNGIHCEEIQKAVLQPLIDSLIDQEDLAVNDDLVKGQNQPEIVEFTAGKKDVGVDLSLRMNRGMETEAVGREDMNQNVQEESDSAPGKELKLDLQLLGDNLDQDLAKEDIAEGLSLGMIRGTETEMIGEGTDVGDRLLEEDREIGHEVPSPLTSLVDMNPDAQEEDTSVPMDEAEVTKDSDLIKGDSLVEAQIPDGNPIVENLMGEKDFVTIILDSVMDVPVEAVIEVEGGNAHFVNDNLRDRGDLVVADIGSVKGVMEIEAPNADRHPVDGNATNKGDIVLADATSPMVVESQSEDTQLVDENLNDGNIMMANSCSVGLPVVEAQSSNTHHVRENPTDKEVFMAADSNSVAEISVPATFESSENETFVSQGKQSVSPVLGENQGTEAQFFDTLVDGSLGSEAHEHETFALLPNTLPGRCQNMDMEAPNVEISPFDGCSSQVVEAVQKSEAGEEIPVPVDGVANDVLETVTNEEEKVQVGELELLEKAEKQAVRIGSCIENDQHASCYLSPQEEKTDFFVSDLIWGKVKSHPWWPGQIFDPSDASEMALKHQRKDNFLIAYFGDKTFAWCDESQMKPFQTFFSQMEKQSISDAFVNAVNEALGEISRRVELGMTCSCLPEEAYASIKYQKVENAGIREGICSSVPDRSLFVNSFQPNRLVEYIGALAQPPFGGAADRLEFVIAQAQLKAFYHWKGYPELPVFHIGGGLMENDAEVTPLMSRKSRREGHVYSTPTPPDLISGKGKSRFRGSSSNKQKHILEDGRKQKSLSALMEEKKVSHLLNGGKSGSGVKSASKSTSQSSGKKRTVVDFDFVDSGKSKKKRLDSLGDLKIKSPSPTRSTTLSIGEHIRRVASQLTGSPSILKCNGETFEKRVTKGGHRKGDAVGSDVPPQTPLETRRKKTAGSKKYPPSKEMLSQLCEAARDPMKRYSFLSTVISFFTDFWSASASSSSKDKKHVEEIGGKTVRGESAKSKSASSEMSKPDYMQDSYWSDIIFHSAPEKKQLSSGRKRKGESQMQSQKKKKRPAGESSPSLPYSPVLETPIQLQVGTRSPNKKHDLAAERPISNLGEKIVEECTPTALILSFAESDSLPSETDLIRIFSRYGPLKEAETEILRKTSRAKVVFKRLADAEIAFSSAGKYSIFGPALVSYRLKCLPSTPKASPSKTPQGTKDAVPVGGGCCEVSAQAETSKTPQGTKDAASVEDGSCEVSALAETEVVLDNMQGTKDETPVEGVSCEVPAQAETIVVLDNMQGTKDATAVEGVSCEVPESGVVLDTMQGDATGKGSSE